MKNTIFSKGAGFTKNQHAGGNQYIGGYCLKRRGAWTDLRRGLAKREGGGVLRGADTPMHTTHAGIPFFLGGMGIALLGGRLVKERVKTPDEIMDMVSLERCLNER